MHTRIRQLRKSLNLNQTQFAKQLGLTQTSLSMMESGKSKLTEKNVKFICSAFHVNEIWLRTGEGEMFVVLPFEREFAEIFCNLTPALQQYLFLISKELLKAQQQMLTPEQILKMADQLAAQNQQDE